VRKLAFSEPVSIFVGLGFPCEVGDVLEANKILNEWPQSSRDAGHLKALHTCAAILGGHGTATEARRALETFAREYGILAPEALQRAADRMGQEWLPNPSVTFTSIEGTVSKRLDRSIKAVAPRPG
jgi:hypothetical protein